MLTKKDIYQVLGYDTLNGLYFCTDEIDTTKKTLAKLFTQEALKPKSIFYFGNIPFVLFYENPDDKLNLFKTIWNINEAPIVIVTENNVVTIYNGFEYVKETQSLAVLGGEKDLTDFEYFKLVTGITWEKYELQLSYKKRVDFKLLENIKVARSILIRNCGLSNPSANALLGKTIFARYLIDRHVRIGFASDPRIWTAQDLCGILNDKETSLKFFAYLEQKFKGNLFEIEDPHNVINQDGLNVIIDLLNGVELINQQLSLFDIYDFSIIPVEFISNVYEMFIGEKEQAISGAYYTPIFLVDYITTETVGRHFELNPKSATCRVLDPACGSGIFLVETLRVLIEKYNLDNPNLPRESTLYRDNLIRLTQENIFGVDKDKSALSVAIFSVYLTLLDYQSPRDIENFEFPVLLNTNFFNGDFFDYTAPFNELFKKQSFDYIVGNPPWRRGGGKEKILEPYENYVKNRKAKESNNTISISISNKEIAQAFLLRTSDFCSSTTIISFIVTSKTLYNLNAKDFRLYFFNNYFVDRIFELAPVRREVFDKSNDPAIAPAAILFYRYAGGNPTKENFIEHFSIKPNRFFSLFKLFLIQRNDVKKLRQSLVIEYDWLLKVLLYGNFNDFYFIKRLKDHYTTISRELSNHGCLVGQGAMLNGNRTLQDASYLVGKSLIRTKEDFHPFSIQVDANRVWTATLALYPRDPMLYKAPQLLIAEGISAEFRAVSAINYDKEIVFKSSLTAVRSDNVGLLETVCGYINSSLFSYYALITTSSAGVEREQTHDKEKLGFPFRHNDAIKDMVKHIHGQSEAYLEDRKKIMSIDDQTTLNQLKENKSNLDELVLQSFELNEVERSLVDYAIQYSIPSIAKSKAKSYSNSTLKFNDILLEEYIQAFKESIGKSFRLAGKSFSVEVWYSSHLIGIFFKVLDILTDDNINTSWVNKNNQDIMKIMISLGHQKITDLIFLQKDIRGFEKDCFYIFKPNEKKVWHKAMAYLDLNDFTDAILKAGGEE